MSEPLNEEQLRFVRRYIGGLSASDVAAVPDLTELADLFLDAKAEADRSLTGLRRALLDEGDPDTKRIAEFGLNGLTNGNSVTLMAALTDLRRAGPDTRADAIRAVRSQCDRYRDFLARDEMIGLCEDNPFDGGVTIVGPLTRALNAIDAALRSG